MFKATKRKRTVQRPLKLEGSSSPSESSDDEKESLTRKTSIPKGKKTSARSIKKTESNRKAQWGLSFEAVVEKDESQFRKNKKGGMGFGGFKQRDDEAEEENEELAQEGEKYGRQYLDQLKADQKRLIIPTPTTAADVITETSAAHGQDIQQLQRHDEKNQEDIISISSSSPPAIEETVVAGNEAFEYAEQQQKKQEMATVDDNDEEEQLHQEEWEAQVASRGGGYYVNSKAQLLSYSSTIDSPHTTLDTMVSTFQSTIQKLQHSQNDISSKIQRLTVEKQSLEKLIQEKYSVKTELETSLDYYQKLLRNKLIPVIDKLRTLQDKLQLIHDSSHSLAKSRLQTKRHWEDELVKDSSSGGDSAAASILEQIPLVDEFGREIGESYNERQREDRWKQRIDSWDQVIPNINMSTTSDAITSRDAMLFDKARLLYQKASVSDEKILLSSLLFDDRIQAIVDAMLIVESNSTDDDDLSVTSLANIFYEWQTTEKFSEDYRNCYACDSFVDLVSVLVKAEWLSLYVSTFLKNTSDSHLDFSTSFKWHLDLKNHPMTVSSATMQQNDNAINVNHLSLITAPILRRTILPDVSTILKDEYDPSSISETQWLSSIYLFIAQHLSTTKEDAEQVARIGDCILSCFKSCADNIHVPVAYVDDDTNSSCCSVTGTQLFSVLQLYRLQNLATNICKFWLPCFIAADSRGAVNTTTLISQTTSLLKNIIVDRLMKGLGIYLHDKNDSRYPGAQRMFSEAMDTVEIVSDLFHKDDHYKEYILWAAPLQAVSDTLIRS
jgi:hypothetical protein